MYHLATNSPGHSDCYETIAMIAMSVEPDLELAIVSLCGVTAYCRRAIEHLRAVQISVRGCFQCGKYRDPHPRPTP